MAAHLHLSWLRLQLSKKTFFISIPYLIMDPDGQVGLDKGSN
jgi:hypothetical protein